MGTKDLMRQNVISEVLVRLKVGRLYGLILGPHIYLGVGVYVDDFVT